MAITDKKKAAERAVSAAAKASKKAAAQKPAATKAAVTKPAVKKTVPTGHGAGARAKAALGRKASPDASAIKALRAALDLSQESLAQLLRVKARTIVRWEKLETKPSGPAEIEKIQRLQGLVELGLRVYTAAGFRSLLSVPQPAFGGKTGYEVLAFGDFDRVLSALQADSEGLGF